MRMPTADRASAKPFLTNVYFYTDLCQRCKFAHSPLLHP